MKRKTPSEHIESKKVARSSVDENTLVLQDTALEAKPSPYWNEIKSAFMQQRLNHVVLLMIDSYLRNEDRSHLMYLAITECAPRGAIRNNLDRLLLFPLDELHGDKNLTTSLFTVPLVYQRIVRDRDFYFRMHGSCLQFGCLRLFVQQYCEFLADHDIEYHAKGLYQVVLPVLTEPKSAHTINVTFTMSDHVEGSYPHDIIIMMLPDLWMVRFPLQHHDQVGVLESVVHARPVRRSETQLLQNTLPDSTIET